MACVRGVKIGPKRDDARRSHAQPNASSVVKLVLAGDSNVGKTLFSRRAIDPEFCFDAPNASTIGVDFVPLAIDTADGVRVAVQLWDTAGQERYRAISTTVFRGAHAVLLMYDIGSEASFESCADVWPKLLTKHAPSDAAIYLVGNKADLEHLRSVSTARGRALAERLGAEFFEVSAYERRHMDTLLQRVAECAWPVLLGQANILAASSSSSASTLPSGALDTGRDADRSSSRKPRRWCAAA